MDIIDAYLQIFLVEKGLTEKDFSDALAAFQESNDSFRIHFFSSIVKKMDFMHWAMLMRKNTCLCCGGGFCELVVDYNHTEAAPTESALEFSNLPVPIHGIGRSGGYNHK